MGVNYNDANYSPSLNGYSGVRPFRFWCQKVLPLVYDNSLSYYELLNKVVDYLNKTIEDVANVEGNVDALNDSYNQLQTHVNEALGTFRDYINNYFDNLDVQDEIDAKLDEMASSGALNELIDPLIPGAVTAWLAENVNPVGSAVVVDNSLSVAGAAADAKVAGDLINNANTAKLTGTTPPTYNRATGEFVINTPINVVNGGALIGNITGGRTFDLSDLSVAPTGERVYIVFDRNTSSIKLTGATPGTGLTNYILGCIYKSQNRVDWYAGPLNILNGTRFEIATTSGDSDSLAISQKLFTDETLALNSTIQNTGFIKLISRTPPVYNRSTGIISLQATTYAYNGTLLIGTLGSIGTEYDVSNYASALYDRVYFVYDAVNNTIKIAENQSNPERYVIGCIYKTNNVVDWFAGNLNVIGGTNLQLASSEGDSEYIGVTQKLFTDTKNALKYNTRVFLNAVVIPTYDRSSGLFTVNGPIEVINGGKIIGHINGNTTFDLSDLSVSPTGQRVFVVYDADTNTIKLTGATNTYLQNYILGCIYKNSDIVDWYAGPLEIVNGSVYNVKNNTGDSSTYAISQKYFTNTIGQTANAESSKNAGITAVDEKINRIYELNKNTKLLNFAFITDTHFNGLHEAGDRTAEGNISLFNRLMNAQFLDFGVFGGDLITAYNIDGEEGRKLLTEGREKFGSHGVPFFMLKGNHDCLAKYRTLATEPYDWSNTYYIYNGATNTYDVVTQETWDGVTPLHVGPILTNQVMSDSEYYFMFQSYLKDVTRNANDEYGCYFYYDIDNTRIICLNNYDNSELEEAKIEGTQLKWLAEVALDFSDKENPSDWQVIILQHMYLAGEKIFTVLSAFRNGQSVNITSEGIEITKDYSTQGNGNVVCIIHGDRHEQTYASVSGVKCLGVGAAYAPLNYIGRPSEFCFSIFTLDTENRTIYETTIGRNANRSYTY